MSDATPVPSKPWWQSKTVILNLIALVSMMLPPVREWLDGNTETPLAALAALNLLVRFATKGKISLFPADDGSAGGNAAGGNGASGGHNAGVGTGGHDRNGQRASFFPWLVVVACAACLLVVPACTVGVDAEGGWSIKPDPRTIDAGLKYLIRHEGDAKSGLSAWEYFDPATGEKIKPEDYASWGITASPAE